MPVLEIPGYAEALASERRERNAAFVSGLHETICGVDVRPLTPRITLELDAAGSPFFSGGLPTEADVFAFFWHLSPARVSRPPSWWVFGRKRWVNREKDKLARKLVTLDYVETVLAIKEFIEESCGDGPSNSGGGSEPAFAAPASALVDYFAHEYGWSEDAILDTPLKRLCQYWRRSVRRMDSKTQFINVLSDRVRSRFLDTLNEQKQ